MQQAKSPFPVSVIFFSKLPIELMIVPNTPHQETPRKTTDMNTIPPN